MNVWRVAWKEFKTIRDIRVLLLQVIGPVLLILILGTVLTNAFNGSIAIGDIRVLYTNNSTQNEDLTAYFETFIEQAGKDGMLFEPVNDSKEAMLKVENNLYVGYVELSDKGLHYYGNSQSQIESDIAQSHLAAFANRYKLAVEAGKTDQEQAQSIMAIEGGRSGYVVETSLNAARQPSAMDYYAIAMLTLIILYGALTAAELIDSERKRNTAARLLASPITKAEIFAGKIAGSLLQSFISVIIVVLLCKYMFNVYWGDNLSLVLLVLFSEIVFALSLGLGLSYLFKSNIASSIIIIMIQVGAFFGGSYFPIEVLTGVMRSIANLFPLTWTNEALLQLIYINNGSAALNAMLLNIGFSVLLLGAALIIMRKREGM